MKKRWKKTHRVLADVQGDCCPRCATPTQVRVHKQITDKHRRQPYYYSRWYYCVNPNCRTTLIMPERFRVFKGEPQPVSSTVADAFDDDVFVFEGPPPWDD
jgi:hypothetical protein